MARTAPELRLGPFLARVGALIDPLRLEDLRELVVQYARRLDLAGRAEFLSFLEASRCATSERTGPAGAPELVGLMHDIEAFVERLAAGAYFDGYQWDDEIHDHRAYGDETWVDEMDAFMDAAGHAFVAGQRQLAADAYGALLHSFLLEEAFSGRDLATDCIATNLTEAKARYLRALYDVTPPEERAERLLGEVRELSWVGGFVDLAGIEQADAPALPARAAFLDGWVDVLRAHSSGPVRRGADRDVRRLLREAVALSGGTEGLGRLARERGDDHPEAYREWIARLESGGEAAAALEAAREAVAAIRDPRERAALADELARLAEQSGDADAALDARRTAWRCSPSTGRLVAVWTSGVPCVAEAVHRMDAEREALGRGDYEVTPRLAATLDLLAGDHAAAADRLRRENAVGWSDSQHPGPVVVPALLVACAGASAPSSTSVLGQFWSALVTGRLDMDVGFYWDALEGFSTPEPARDSSSSQSLPPLAAVLEAALEHRPLAAVERPAVREFVLSVVRDRVRAIVSAKHRGAYARAAQLAVAAAEGLIMAGLPDRARSLLDTVRGEFPRHYAFRDELDRAMTASSLAPSPPPRRR